MANNCKNFIQNNEEISGMKLTYYDSGPNFGDDLNRYVWPRLLPEGFLNDDDSEWFLGFGSILWDDLPKDKVKFVMGSGYGGYTAPPNISDGSWDIQFLRGPRTARAIGADDSKAICDSAILIRETELPKAATSTINVAFMPHVDSLKRGNWQDACQLANVHLIDPTTDHELILSQLLSTKLLITEAMHGAIVADALRVPWIAVEPIHPAHRFKWYDWADALELKLRPQALTSSSARELWTQITGRQGESAFVRGLDGKLAFPVNYITAHKAAKKLTELSKCEPQLSSDYAMNNALDRSLTVIDNFVRARKAVT